MWASIIQAKRHPKARACKIEIRESADWRTHVEISAIVKLALRASLVDSKNCKPGIMTPSWRATCTERPCCSINGAIVIWKSSASCYKGEKNWHAEDLARIPSARTVRSDRAFVECSRWSNGELMAAHSASWFYGSNLRSTTSCHWWALLGLDNCETRCSPSFLVIEIRILHTTWCPSTAASLASDHVDPFWTIPKHLQLMLWGQYRHALEILSNMTL